MGPTKVNDFSKTMDLPGMNTKTFKKHERIIGPIIEMVADETVADAVEIERGMTMEKIEEIKKTL